MYLYEAKGCQRAALYGVNHQVYVEQFQSTNSIEMRIKHILLFLLGRSTIYNIGKIQHMVKTCFADIVHGSYGHYYTYYQKAHGVTLI